MQSHKLHGPGLYTIAVPKAPGPGDCAYCHATGTVRNNHCPKCDTWFPSPLSYRDPSKSKFPRKTSEHVEDEDFELDLPPTLDEVEELLC